MAEIGKRAIAKHKVKRSPCAKGGAKHKAKRLPCAKRAAAKHKAKKAPLCKGSWREATEGLFCYCLVGSVNRQFQNSTIPPSCLRHAASLYTREALNLGGDIPMARIRRATSL